MQKSVCLGMPIFNQTVFLKEALDSLLAQTYESYRLIIIDDSTISEPSQIVRSYAERDSRITYIRNSKRRGMVGNWQACVHAANDADFFAWVSDHDIWATHWLERLVGVLEENPLVVLAYPLTEHIEMDGSIRIRKSIPPFSTKGLSDKNRIRAVCKEAKGFGNMIYGLFRLSSLKRAGIFRRLLFPDVVVLHEISFWGEIHQIPEKLWFRRHTGETTDERQRRTLFGESRPWYVLLPWPIVNSCSILWNSAVRWNAGPLHRRWLGARMAQMYLKRWGRNYVKANWHHIVKKGKKQVTNNRE
jgi:glycosyltransferase involved in cell wall biosynthesis